MNKTLIILSILILSSCSALDPRPHANTESAYTSEQLSLQFLKLFREQGNLEDLMIAEKLALNSYRARPDDITVQRAYYQTQFLRVALSPSDKQSTSLKDLYQKLNPIIAKQLAPPSKIIYANAKAKGAPVEEQLQLALRVIEEQPAFADGWFEVALLFTQQQRYWEALYPAERAVDLYPQSDQYHYLAGQVLTRLAKTHSQIEKPLLFRAKSYLNTAIAINPKKEYLVAIERL